MAHRRSERRYWLLAVPLVIMLLAGCGSTGAVGSIGPTAAQLLIYDGSCYVGPIVGLLVRDTKYGTAAWFESGGPEPPRLVPIAWRKGYVGRHVGSQIEVVAPDGRVVATTGNRYELMGGGVTTVDGIGAWGVCAVDP